MEGRSRGSRACAGWGNRSNGLRSDVGGSTEVAAASKHLRRSKEQQLECSRARSASLAPKIAEAERADPLIRSDVGLGLGLGPDRSWLGLSIGLVVNRGALGVRSNGHNSAPNFDCFEGRARAMSSELRLGESAVGSERRVPPRSRQQAGRPESSAAPRKAPAAAHTRRDQSVDRDQRGDALGP